MGQRTQQGQADVDEQVDIAAALEEHTEGREEDGADELGQIAVQHMALARWKSRERWLGVTNETVTAMALRVKAMQRACLR